MTMWPPPASWRTAAMKRSNPRNRPCLFRSRAARPTAKLALACSSSRNVAPDIVMQRMSVCARTEYARGASNSARRSPK